MYYDEKVINGILHWRNTPDGNWIPFSSFQLTKMYLKAKEDYQGEIERQAGEGL